ncbi:MAG: amidohydrolase family protein [Chloroflexota bacterium]|nr:amidohydrolase family protein [Chloroflexota bacterium]
MDILLTDTMVIPSAPEGTVIRQGAVAIHNDRIVAVGKTEELEQQYPNSMKIPLANRAVMPGLINAHTHSVLNVLRGTVENGGAVNRVYGYMVPITFAMSDEDRQALATVGCLEAIRSGTTTMVDPLRFVPSYAQAMSDTGLRLYLAESAADAVTPEIRTSGYRYDRNWGEAFLERTFSLIEGFHNTQNGRVQCMVAAHATDNCSPWMLDTLRELAVSRGLRRTIHLAQSAQEVQQVKNLTSGSTPVEYLRDHGWLGDDVLGAHCTHCSDHDIGLLAETGTSMAHCPASSSRRGFHTLANMPRLIDAGVNVTLGTDNMSEDMFEALRIGIILNRGLREDGEDPTPIDMLTWATTNGARALGRDDLGALTPGMKADLIVVRLDRPHLSPLLDTISSLVHYGQAADVESVMIDGEWVMKNSVVQTLDEETVINKAQEAAIHAWRALHERWPDIPIPSPFQDLI